MCSWADSCEAGSCRKGGLLVHWCAAVAVQEGYGTNSAVLSCTAVGRAASLASQRVPSALACCRPPAHVVCYVVHGLPTSRRCACLTPAPACTPPLPCRRAYNISFLQTKQVQSANGLQTSLGKALSNGDYEVSFDREGKQTIANGGWPANNAPILSWHEACDGVLYVVTATLRPKQQYT